uniref:Uncharacterized protein n=1 Tax=Arundo donax TaxID=35708 RepID=A0A0A9AQ13_ARUDO
MDPQEKNPNPKVETIQRHYNKVQEMAPKDGCSGCNRIYM